MPWDDSRPEAETLDLDLLTADVARRFRMDRGAVSTSPLSIGAEIELIPEAAGTHAPIPIVAKSGTSSVAVIRRAARDRSWIEQSAGDDPPSWSLPRGARISFEPGGQIEISSGRHEGASGLLIELAGVIGILRDEFDRDDVVLTTCGVDEWNAVDAVPLQLHRTRYARMARYFDSIGTSGARMMRQTASIQVNVETGDRPLERWNLLNALSPFLVATFANSSRYESSNTGHASYRAHLWRTLDASRTGLLGSADPVATYTRFALDAGAIFSSPTGDAYPMFREWMARETLAYDDWDQHLSTLFPEIRPKGFFEIRSTDMVDTRWLAAPIAFITGLVYDDPTAALAAELLRTSDNELLEGAGRLAQRDEAISTTSKELMRLAIGGCRQLGTSYITASHVERLEEFADIYTYRRHKPE